VTHSRHRGRYRVTAIESGHAGFEVAVAAAGRPQRCLASGSPWGGPARRTLGRQRRDAASRDRPWAASSSR
jgi:hypothetical protein